jgi:hypothetical protein
MPLKILCAGYGKDEKSDLEKQVQSILGRALGNGWTISLVKLGGQVSVSIDGPDERLKGKSFAVPPMRLRDSLRDMLTAHGFDAAEPAPAPPAPATAARGSAPRPPSGRFSAQATRAAVSTPPPAVRPSGPAARGARSASGRHARDEHACPHCNGRFVVTYELEPNDGRQLVAVACPHCWKIDRVEVGESAAIARSYRADKA